MRAKYQAVCPICRTPINVGDKMGRHDHKWAHENCAINRERSMAIKHRLQR